MTPVLPADQQFYMVVLCQGQMADGEPYWAYLQIAPSKAKAFKKAQKKGAFRLEDYGKVLQWGKGASVPQDVKQRMEAEGANHQFEEEARRILTQHSPEGRAHAHASLKSKKIQIKE